MATVKIKFICSVLGRILLAPKYDSSLRNRVEAIFEGSQYFRDEQFSNSALDAWHLITNARKKPLSEPMRMQYEMRSINKIKAAAGSLTKRELKEVINAYLSIVSSAMK
ncbi:MAG: hypothetical protein ABSC76_18410 [Terracidiphilus sp.]|jgi:hypothetical protein